MERRFNSGNRDRVRPVSDAVKIAEDVVEEALGAVKRMKQTAGGFDHDDHDATASTLADMPRDILLPRGSGFDSDGEGENGNFESVEYRQTNTLNANAMFGDGKFSPTKIGNFFLQLGNNREDIARGEELFKSAARGMKGISYETLYDLARNCSDELYPLYATIIGTLKIMELENERRVFKGCKGPVQKENLTVAFKRPAAQDLPNLPSLFFSPLSGGKGDIKEILSSCSSMTGSLRVVVKHVALHSINEVLPLRSRHLYTVANKPQRGLTAIPYAILNAFVDAFLLVITFPCGDDAKKNEIEGSVCNLWAHYWIYATTKARSDQQKNSAGGIGNSVVKSEESH